MQLHSITPRTARRELRNADADFRATARRGSLRVAPGPIADKQMRSSASWVYVLPLALAFVSMALSVAALLVTLA